MTKKFRVMTGALALVGGLASAGLGGMTAVASADSGPAIDETFDGGLQGVFQMAIKAANSSPVERGAVQAALKNGKIAPAAYEAVHRKYEKCMTDRGFDPQFRKTSQGLYMELPYQEVSAALDTATGDCSKGVSTVKIMYQFQQANPKALTDQRQVAVECLVGAGYAGNGYTADQFERDQANQQFPFDPMAVGPNDCLYGAGYAYFDTGS